MGDGKLELPTSCVSSSRPSAENRISNPENCGLMAWVTGCCTSCCTDGWRPLAPNADLAAVVQAWSYLPEHVRQAIVTLVESVRENESAT